MVERFNRFEATPFVLHTSNEHGVELVKQFEEIASQVTYRGGRAIPIASVESFIPSLTTFLFQGGKEVVEDAQRVASVLDVIGPTARPSAARLEDINVGELTTVVKILKGRPQGELGPQFQVILKALEGAQAADRQVAVQARAAWVPESIDGQVIVETHELVSRREVRKLQDYLTDLKALKSIRQDKFIEAVTAGRYAQLFGDQGELGKWLAAGDVEEPLNKYLQQTERVVARTELFQFTKKDFEAMSAAKRIEKSHLAEKYNEYLQDIRLNADLWKRIGEEEYVWLPTRELP